MGLVKYIQNLNLKYILHIYIFLKNLKFRIFKYLKNIISIVLLLLYIVFFPIILHKFHLSFMYTASGLFQVVCVLLLTSVALRDVKVH